MLKGTPIWTPGTMHLYLNQKPTKAYIPETNVQEAYKKLQSRLSKQGSIPIGIDHLADNIIKANPILAKLNLLDVGEITEIQYTDDAIIIAEAELTNPLIKKLYNKGELDMVSIVADSTTSECPKNPDYTIVDTTDITRVDIVEKGACPTCNIPKPSDETQVVYARYPIQEVKEDNIMAEEAITMEEIQDTVATVVQEAIKPLNEKIDKIDERITKLETGEEPPSTNGEDEVEAMKAEIADLKAQRATAKVDVLIAEGKILPAQKESAVKLCASDATMFDEMYKDAPVIVELDNRQSLQAGNSEGNEPEPTEDEKLIAEVNAAFKKE